MTTYRIKPLDWEQHDKEWRAYSILGEFNIRREWTGDADEGLEPKGGWRWEYSFDERGDNGAFDCEGPDDGKAGAFVCDCERRPPQEHYHPLPKTC